MGYNFHITKAENWYDNDSHQITPEDWLAIVYADPELTPAFENGPYFVFWSGSSEYPEPWFDLVEGNILTKNPDIPILEKMVQIARRLQAKVQGDQGETYPDSG